MIRNEALRFSAEQFNESWTQTHKYGIFFNTEIKVNTKWYIGGEDFTKINKGDWIIIYDEFPDQIYVWTNEEYKFYTREDDDES